MESEFTALKVQVAVIKEQIEGIKDKLSMNDTTQLKESLNELSMRFIQMTEWKTETQKDLATTKRIDNRVSSLEDTLTNQKDLLKIILDKQLQRDDSLILEKITDVGNRLELLESMVTDKVNEIESKLKEHEKQLKDQKSKESIGSSIILQDILTRLGNLEQATIKKPGNVTGCTQGFVPASLMGKLKTPSGYY
jgi:hypothetical protein